MTTVPSGGGITGMVVGRVLGQLAADPVRVQYPHPGPVPRPDRDRALVQDPTPLIQAVLPELLRNRDTTINAVQPEESEPVQ